MKTINASTKKGAALIQSYRMASASSLNECYTSCSHSKYIAERNCREWMAWEQGEGFRIMSFNTFSFTCGWRTAEGLRVETSSNSYLVK